MPTVKEYDSQGHLSEGDVSLDNPTNPTVVWIHIKASKTDPFSSWCMSTLVRRVSSGRCSRLPGGERKRSRPLFPFCIRIPSVLGVIGQAHEDSSSSPWYRH